MARTVFRVMVRVPEDSDEWIAFQLLVQQRINKVHKSKILCVRIIYVRRKEGNVSFNDALNTIYVRLYDGSGFPLSLSEWSFTYA